MTSLEVRNTYCLHLMQTRRSLWSDIVVLIDLVTFSLNTHVMSQTLLGFLLLEGSIYRGFYRRDEREA